jgi:aspartate carbamoyltransferase catalytic subunit
MSFPHRHLLGIEPLNREEILRILDEALALKEVLSRPVKKVATLRGKLIVNLFYEPSTRTRSSFEIAAKRLSADAVNWTTSGSSASKGETFFDTVKNLEVMGPDILVVRHSSSGAPEQISQRVKCAVINAGDGSHEHPSQALLDAFTLREHLGALEGRTVAIVGDIAHSRVARSNIHCLTKLGVRVRLCGPHTMMPPGIEALAPRGQIERTHRLEDAVKGADAVMMLRIQQERIGEPLFPSLREYSRVFGLGVRAAELLAPHAVILHPGPINRGVELSPELADGPRSLILDQVENGVAVRMAILYLLSSNAGPEA